MGQIGLLYSLCTVTKVSLNVLLSTTNYLTTFMYASEKLNRHILNRYTLSNKCNRVDGLIQSIL